MNELSVQIIYDHLRSYGSSTWNNFTQLHGNLGLSSLVVFQGKFCHNLSCVLWGVLHSVHSCTLFWGDIVEKGVVEHRVDVEFVEEMGSMTEIWFFSIMLNDIPETFQELFLGQDFGFSQKLTDDVFEFVIDNQNSVAILSMIKNLVGNWWGLIIYGMYLLGSSMGFGDEWYRIQGGLAYFLKEP